MGVKTQGKEAVEKVTAALNRHSRKSGSPVAANSGAFHSRRGTPYGRPAPMGSTIAYDSRRRGRPQEAPLHQLRKPYLIQTVGLLSPGQPGGIIAPAYPELGR